MNNVMKIDGHQAFIAFDPEIELFRGEFIGLNGDADFYASDVAGLQRKGAISLAVFFKNMRRKRHRAPEKFLRESCSSCRSCNP